MQHLLILFLALGSISGLACRSAVRDERASETLQLRILGMTCPVNCPPRVEAALASVAGVESATVDYESRTATVVASKALDQKALLSALERQGFAGTLL